MISAVHHVQVSIPVGEEKKARVFYGGVLGLHEIPKPDALAGRGGFWMVLGSIQIHFGTEDDVDRSKTKSHVAYLVDDLESWRLKLSEHGCRITDGMAIPNFDRFECRDPFGNRMEFLEPKS